MTLSGTERRALRANRFFAEMDPDVCERIADRGRLRRLRTGEALFAKGDSTDGVYAMLSGTLRYSTVSPSGREAILNILGPGKWLGDISTLDGAGRTLDCVAIEDSTLMHLSKSDFNELLDNVPAFARMLLRIQGERIRDLLLWTEALTKLDAEGRLAVRLLLFAQSHGSASGSGVSIRLGLSQEALASLIGTTRQRVNQILRRWKSDNVVETDSRSVTISDLAALRRLVDLS